MPRIIAAACITLLLAACSESATAPETSNAPTGNAPLEHPSLNVALPGTTASITSVSCTLTTPATGEILCSYDIANPDHLLLNIYGGASLYMAYQCVNSSTGKIQSSGIEGRWLSFAVMGTTEANPTGTNVQVSTATTLPNTYTKRYTKLNTCKGKQSLVITNYSMPYFDVLIDNHYSGQPDAEFSWACLGTDTRYGCAVL